ncbi:hypothetical protein PUNSTDRAFT_133750 [Punctularia strigosozonata HHB-11173 SS5]|uniref:uncharacterized protein n=1 Tax=Punctularia strigosozonata (strain HHB-11173) TaxID=741275 RepID=UPI0004418531|nr:uncharacterized protein PUNSTDRAFT_133750 [Punctularia strigosozonata HHB-11173 SS5]EIN09983.1 hypothetical protein PUNSTDRAFT_133750 [Punctularia strigosozonata HHB-11173 SS5]
MPYDELSSGPNPFPSHVDNPLPSRHEKDDQQSLHSRDRLELPSDAQDFDTTDSDTDSTSVTFAANPEYYNHLMTNIALWQRRSTTTPQPGDLWSILDPDDLATMSWDEWIPLVFDSPSDRSMAGYAGRDSYSWSNSPPLQTLRPAHLLRREALDAEPGPALPAPPFPNPLIPRIGCLDNGSFSILAVPVDVENPLIWTLTAPILGDVHIGIHIRMEYASTWVCGTVRSIFRLHDDCVTVTSDVQGNARWGYQLLRQPECPSNRVESVGKAASSALTLGKSTRRKGGAELDSRSLDTRSTATQ